MAEPGRHHFVKLHKGNAMTFQRDAGAVERRCGSEESRAIKMVIESTIRAFRQVVRRQIVMYIIYISMGRPPHEGRFLGLWLWVLRPLKAN